MQEFQHPELTILVGCGRSGTTYLSRVITNALDIGMYNMGETDHIPKLHRRIRQYGDLQQDENLRKLINDVHDTKPFRNLKRIHKTPTSAEEIYQRVEDRSYVGVIYASLRLMADTLGKSRLGYKDPWQVTHLPLLADLFPNARFIHVIRDGRDTALSLKNQVWGPNNLYTAALYWRNTVRKAQQDGQVLSDRYCEIRFEDLILNTENVAAKLVAFINDGEDQQVADTFLQEVNRTKKIDGISGWKQKLSDEEQRLIETVAGPVLRYNGYDIDENAQPMRISGMQRFFYHSHDYTLRLYNRLTRDLEPET
jgi:hypothetical protein